VKLNQRNPAVKEYLFDVIRFWVKEFDIDGIRLDAADVLDFDFMKQMRYETDRMKEDFWLMGEVIHGDYSRWANDETLHAVTNYELHKGLYSGHNDHNYFEIAHSIRRLNDICRGRKLYTFVDNHDVERIYSKLNNKEHVKLVTILLYTLYGIPSVYYGSEFGIEGKKEKGSDWNLRPCLELEDFADALETNPVTKLCAALGKMKKEYPELTFGEYRELYLNNRQFAYGRVLQDSAIITLLNSDDAPASFEVPSPVDTSCVTDLLGLADSFSGEQGRICVTLPANTGTVILVGRCGEKVSGTETLKTSVPSGETKKETIRENVSETAQETSDTGEETDRRIPEEKTPAPVRKEKAAAQSGYTLSGITVMVDNLDHMVSFYRDALGFALEQQGDRAYLKKDGMVLSLYSRRKFEQLTCRGYGYGGGVTGHFHLRLLVEDTKSAYDAVLSKGAAAIKEPFTNEWGEQIAYVADPEGNVIALVWAD
jgi:catechol 2,3-dioxygenase-like lactoylglutathione lyase family enzyme